MDDSSIDVRAHNRDAWDQLVKRSNRWTQPVGPAEIERARRGDFEIVLTPTKPVPADWFPDLEGCQVLCLAASGGQQAPILAAAGACVTVLDNSPAQLAQDRQVAQRESLQIKLVEGDMADLSMFAADSFNLIFHPCSNAFVPDVEVVWREAFRVLQRGGTMLSGFTNPVRYLFDDERTENGRLEVMYKLPYSDLDHTELPHIRKLVEAGEPLEFGHTLESQIGGQLRAGFVLIGMFEDHYHDVTNDPLSRYMDSFIATRSRKA